MTIHMKAFQNALKRDIAVHSSNVCYNKFMNHDAFNN